MSPIILLLAPVFDSFDRFHAVEVEVKKDRVRNVATLKCAAKSVDLRKLIGANRVSFDDGDVVIAKSAIGVGPQNYFPSRFGERSDVLVVDFDMAARVGDFNFHVISA